MLINTQENGVQGMRFTKLLLSASFGLAIAGFAGAASATPIAIPVANASFETLPAGGLSNPCGTGCSYSSGTNVPGWISGGTLGQFQPGVSSGNTTYFNSIPDGSTVFYSNGGYLYQQIVSSITAGTNYELLVDLGFRKDIADNGTAWLQVGNTLTDAAFATGTPLQLSGDWSTYTALLNASAADAGKSLYIVLNNPGSGQADFDNVRAFNVPEPGSLSLLGAGLLAFLGLGFVNARRKGAKLAA